jgi:phenylpyruvate tautomerase PptA (4-oxalocrotonate tautomerase family)
MPLIRISVHDAMPTANRRAVADAVYAAMRNTLGIPEGDRFIILSAHTQDEFYIDPSFMGVNRSDKFVLIHATFRRGRSNEVKQAFFQETAHLLHLRADIDPQDVMIVLSENDSSDWSFGRGEAQFLNAPPAPAPLTPTPDTSTALATTPAPSNTSAPEK